MLLGTTLGSAGLPTGGAGDELDITVCRQFFLGALKCASTYLEPMLGHMHVHPSRYLSTPFAFDKAREGPEHRNGVATKTTTYTELNEKQKAQSDIVLMDWQTRGSTLLGISPCVGQPDSKDTSAPPAQALAALEVPLLRLDAHCVDELEWQGRAPGLVCVRVLCRGRCLSVPLNVTLLHHCDRACE